MTTPRRFTKGVTNVDSNRTYGQFLEPDPTKVYGYSNDFFVYAATDWVLTTAEAGAGSASEAIADDETGGVLVVTNAGGSGDHDNFQLSKDGGTNDSESFGFSTGKKAWFKARFKSNDGDQIHSFIGLHITNTDPVNAAPTNGVYFEITGGVITMVVRKDSVSSSETLVATLGDDTFVELGYYWDGIDTFSIFVDDLEITPTVGGANLPSELLAVSFGVENEEADTNTLELDYIEAYMER